jgi:hypothetical protein
MNNRLLVLKSAFAAILSFPALSLAGWLNLPPAFRSHHSAALAKPAAGAAAAVTGLADTYGFWRSSKTTSDSGATSSSTVEMWIGSNGKTELRMSLNLTDSANPDLALTMALQSKGTWTVVGANILETDDSCTLTNSLFGSTDCKSEEPDTTALADIEVKTVAGKKAMITHDTTDGGSDDTLYYVGATPAFTVAPVSPTRILRFEAADGDRRLRSVGIFGSEYRVPGARGLTDLRGRAMPAARPGQGIFFIHRP